MGRPTGTGPPALMMADRHTEHDHTKGDTMARYHITITDNKEGKTIHDHDTDIIIGVFGTPDDDGEMCGIMKTAQWDAPGKRIVHAMIALDELREQNNKDHPLEAMLVGMYKAAHEDDGDDESEGDAD